MQITDLKAQVKDPDRVSVYIDGKFHCGLTVAQVVDLKVKRGLEIDEAFATKLKKHSDLGKMHARALEWLLMRPRSSRELDDYLRKKGYDASESDYVRARVEKYLDDQSFAQFWVDGRRNSKLKSAREIKFELSKKGVSSSEADRALGAAEISDLEVLKKLIEKKRLTTKYPDRNKLVAYLARKGFKYSDIDSALSDN